MSTVVPACIIRSVWYEYNGQKEMPVSFDYLKMICGAVCPVFNKESKSKLGIRMKVHLDEHKSNHHIGFSMMYTMCADNDTVGAEGRRCMLTTMKLLGTHYAFTLP